MSKREEVLAKLDALTQQSLLGGAKRELIDNMRKVN